MNGKERNEHDALCPHCGAEAKWLFLNPEKSRIEVMCRDCGRYELTREEFDRKAVESTEVDETDAA